MNSNFSALLCQDTLHIILENLSLADLPRAAGVCRLRRMVASDRDVQILTFAASWKIRDVIGNPSSGSFDNSLTSYDPAYALAEKGGRERTMSRRMALEFGYISLQDYNLYGG